MAKRILVVDDDPAILDALQEMLEGHDYVVKAVGHADRVFEEIKAFKPQLILMDVMLSGMDGRNICRSLRGLDNYKNIPVIMLSANVNAYDIMFEQGAPNDFLAKPFNMHDLLSKIAVQLAA